MIAATLDQPQNGLSYWMDHVLPTVQPHITKSHRAQMRAHIAKWKELLGDTPVNEIGYESLIDFRQRHSAEGGTKDASNRIQTTIRLLAKMAGNCIPKLRPQTEGYRSQVRVWCLSRVRLLDGEDGRIIWTGTVAMESDEQSLCIAVAMLQLVPPVLLASVKVGFISVEGAVERRLSQRVIFNLRAFWQHALSNNWSLGEGVQSSSSRADPVRAGNMANVGAKTALIDFFKKEYLFSNLKLGKASAGNYFIALRQLDKFNKGPVLLGALTPNLVISFMRALRETGSQTARTINNKRAAIKTVWSAAAEAGYCTKPGRIPKLSQPKRVVHAWTVEEVARILDACECASPIEHWSPDHWKALVLTIYDTSHRVGALLKTPRSSLNADGVLLVPAEFCKQNSDALQKLHDSTVKMINSLPASNRLFPWPRSIKELWPRFKEILRAAKLPATRKDLFHKLRRTSFTYVYASLGPQAAREHAGHNSDCVSHYLDTRLLREIQQIPDTVESLPRPQPCDSLERATSCS